MAEERCVICTGTLADDDHHTREYGGGHAHDECIADALAPAAAKAYEVAAFAERSSWPLGTRVQHPDDPTVHGAIVKRGARRWAYRDNLPMVRWDGMIDAESVPWERLIRFVPERKFLVARFDITDLRRDEADYLAGEVNAQAERSDGHPGVPVDVEEEGGASLGERRREALIERVEFAYEFMGMGLQDEAWWPELCALAVKMKGAR